MTQTRAVIYASTARSVLLSPDNSIEQQFQTCRGAANRDDCAVVEEIGDVDTSTRGRPGFARVVEMAQAGACDAVITYAPDRFGRRPGPLAELAATGVRIVYAGVEAACGPGR
jgi:DNA invertase Pin-like site-specific DNA recombinase